MLPVSRERMWKVAGWSAAVVCAIATLLPLFVTRDLPLVDLPSNLGAIALWNNYDDARYGLAQHYKMHLGLVPYSGYYGFVHGMSWIMPIRVANKLFMAGVLLGLPAALAAWLRAHKRPPILALAAFPLAWSYLIAWGFIAWSAGAALLIYALALLARLADARPWPTARLLWGNVAIGFGLYLLHPLAWLLWVPAVLYYVPRRLSLLVAPSGALFAYQLMNLPRVGLFDVGKQHAEQLSGEWLGVGKNLKQLRRFLFDFVPQGMFGRDGLMIGLLATLVLAAVLVRRDRTAQQDRRPWMVFGFIFFCYLALPVRLATPLNWSLINTRMPALGLAVLFGCVAMGQLTRWRATLVVVPLVAATLWYTTAITRKFSSFDHRARDFYAVVDKLPYAPRVLTLIYNGDDPALELHGHGWVWRHWSSLVQVERGGWNPHAWDLGFPAMQRPGVKHPVVPPDGSPDQFRWEKHAAEFDWFLTRSERGPVFSGRKDVELVAESGEWKLWKKKQ